MTFNLKWGRHVDRAADLFTRPGPLRDADLVVLEEMDQPGTERLARALGFDYVYVPSAVHPVPKQDFGVALLSPWPLEEPRKLLLPHQNRFRKLRRSAAVATLRSPLGPIRVYGVHLESPAGAWDRVRRDQARVVLADAEDWVGPVVVAGRLQRPRRPARDGGRGLHLGDRGGEEHRRPLRLRPRPRPRPVPGRLRRGGRREGRDGRERPQAGLGGARAVREPCPHFG